MVFVIIQTVRKRTRHSIAFGRYETPHTICLFPNKKLNLNNERDTMDRRQRKSRRAIYAAFESLMTEQHYSQVTVAQIIERADVGRSTFYAHFETKDDLLRSICTEMFDHIFEGVNSYCITHQELQTIDLQGKLAHLLYHLRDSHSGVCGKLISEKEPFFTAYFQKQLKELIDAEAIPPNTEAPTDLMSSMLVSAFCQAVAWWLDNGAEESPEHIALWFSSLQSKKE